MRSARSVGKREDEFVRALPEVLERVAGELRAGASPLAALAGARRGSSVPPVLAADLGLVVERAGEDGFGPALEAWAQERPHSAVESVAAALELTAGVGGPSAPALEGLAIALRDGEEAAGEVDALATQGRMSAVVVGAAPVVLLLLSLAADPRVASTLVGTPAGRACLLLGLTLEAAAALWIRRIVRRRPWDDDVAATAELLAAALTAGLTPYLAIGTAARFGRGATTRVLGAVRHRADSGVALSDALEAEAAPVSAGRALAGRAPAGGTAAGRAPSGLGALLTVLAQSERAGTAAAPTLQRLAASVRAQARRRAVARARTVPVRLLFPLVFLVLPAFLVLTVAPVLLAGLDH